MNIQYSEAISVDHCSCFLIQISHYSSAAYPDAQWRDRIQPEEMRLDRCIRTGHVVQSPGLLFEHHGLQIHHRPLQVTDV